MKKLILAAKQFAHPIFLAVVALAVSKYFQVLATTSDIHLMSDVASTALQAVCALVAAGFWFVCILEIQNIRKLQQEPDCADAEVAQQQ